MQVHPHTRHLHAAAGALEVHAPLRPQPPVAAAERERLHVLAEAREALDSQAHAPDDPDRLVLDTGVLDVGVGHVLHPAREAVQAYTAARRRVGQAGSQRSAEDAAHIGDRDDLAQLHRLEWKRTTALRSARVPVTDSDLAHVQRVFVEFNERYDALRDGGVAAYHAEFYAPDSVIEQVDSFPSPGRYEGLDGYLEWFGDSYGDYRDVTWEILGIEPVA